MGFLERARLAKRNEQASAQSDAIDKIHQASKDLDTIQKENEVAKRKSSLERTHQKSENSIASFHESNISAEKQTSES